MPDGWPHHASGVHRTDGTVPRPKVPVNGGVGVPLPLERNSNEHARPADVDPARAIEWSERPKA